MPGRVLSAHDAGHRAAWRLGGWHADRCPFATARTADPSRRLDVAVAWQPVSNVGLFLSRCRCSKLAAFGGSAWAAAGIVPSAVSLASCSPDVRAPDQTREGALTAPSRDWPSHWGLTRRPELARPLHCAQRFGLRTFATAPLHSRHSSVARQAKAPLREHGVTAGAARTPTSLR